MIELELSRRLQQNWKRKFKRSHVNAVVDFCCYTESLLQDLLAIRENDRAKFDSQTDYTIDSYISVLQHYKTKFESEVFDYEKFNEFKKNLNPTTLANYRDELRRNFNKMALSEKFVFDKWSSATGFNPEYFKSINSIAKKIFLLEKYCGSILKKTWDTELTDMNTFDQREPFTIIVKIIFPYGWRGEKQNTSKYNFAENRIYQSCSVIGDKSMFCLFNYYNQKTSALLVYEPDSSKVVCGRRVDAFSEEYINEKNPYNDKSIFADTSRVDISFQSGKIHELYATATEVVTPNTMLKNGGTYNELIMRNPKVVGVLAPNKRSEEYAKQVAREYGVKYHGVLDMIEQVKYDYVQ